MKGPLISVIIPIYNAGRYLKHAVDSVINQTYTNLEIILVDDHSEDDSLSICRSYYDPRITIISNPQSLGAAGARNRALDVFTGEYVAFVDADDYVHPQFIEILYKAIRENQGDISCCRFLRTDENSDNFVYPQVTDQANTIVMSGTEAALNIVDIKSMFYVVFWNKLFKRYIWEDLRLPTGKRAEDFYTSYLFLSRANRIVYIEETLYWYYQQKQSVMHMFDDFSIYMEEALDGFENFLNERITDSQLRCKYSDLALIFRTDTVVEDYYKAYIKKDKPRMDETYSRALVLKREMEMRGIPLRIKFKLFYGNLFLYRVGRGVFGLMETMSIRFHKDRSGDMR